MVDCPRTLILLLLTTTARGGTITSSQASEGSKRRLITKLNSLGVDDQHCYTAMLVAHELFVYCLECYTLYSWLQTCLIFVFCGVLEFCAMIVVQRQIALVAMSEKIKLFQQSKV